MHISLDSNYAHWDGHPSARFPSTSFASSSLPDPLWCPWIFRSPFYFYIVRSPPLSALSPLIPYSSGSVWSRPFVGSLSATRYGRGSLKAQYSQGWSIWMLARVHVKPTQQRSRQEDQTACAEGAGARRHIRAPSSAQSHHD